MSKATIYNNLNVLIDSGLVRKHQFGKGTVYYENVISAGNTTISYNLIEFCDARIEAIKKAIEDTFGIQVNRHSLYFYAVCRHEIVATGKQGQ